MVKNALLDDGTYVSELRPDGPSVIFPFGMEYYDDLKLDRRYFITPKGYAEVRSRMKPLDISKARAL